MSLQLSYKTKESIYIQHLKEINRINFTPREIDIIACIVHNRGEKKIASILSISPRTVETHTRNIMLKSGCSSKDHLIDFIEKFGKLEFIKIYYEYLLIYIFFCNQLKLIGKNINNQPYTCTISYERIDAQQEKFLQDLAEHLTMANIILKPNANSDRDNNTLTAAQQDIQLYVVSEKLLLGENQDNRIFLLLNKNITIPGTNNINYVDFTKDYYLATLILVKKILKRAELDNIIQEFSNRYPTIQDSSNKESTNNITITPTSVILLPTLKKLSRKKIYLVLTLLTCLIILAISLARQKFSYPKNSFEYAAVRSDFVIPHKSMILERPLILSQIKEKLNTKDNIKKVVLIGIGGAGKTTLARMYGAQQDSDIVFEINAETTENIINSFESLSEALSQTEQDKKLLNNIQEISDDNKRKEKLLLFIKKHFKAHPNWVLIFDNVETFQDIKDYFPYDEKAWGKGKIIITTRNNAIANNSYIGGDQGIFLEELSPDEQFDLFTKILNSGKIYQFTSFERRQITEFLKNIPSFPLDVSTAAYYIKEIGITYAEYLDRKEQCSQEFVTNQENVIKEKSNYIKNRYGIVTLSLRQLIAKSPDFTSLLLLISMVDSQNIPRNLLDAYKNKIVVDNFLNKLSTYAIINRPDSRNNDNFVFSLHRSTQAIILNYLTLMLRLKNDPQLIESISTVLEHYIHQVLETEDLVLIRQILPHIISFIEKDLVSEKSKAHLKSQIGHIYWAVYADHTKAVNILNQALTIQEKYYTEPNPHTAYTLGELGIAYRQLGDNKTSKECIEHSIELYKNYYKSEDSIEIARLFVTSTGFYKRTDYQKTVEDYYKGLAIYKKYYGEDHIKTAWIYSGLGTFYRMWGKYNKSKTFLEKTISIHQHTQIKNKIEYAWLVINLGIVYQNIGDLKKAKEFIDQGLSIYKKILKKDSVEIAWGQIHLAMTYGHLGNWKKAKQIVEKYLPCYMEYYDHNHENIAWILEKLGIVQRELKDFKNAYQQFTQSKEIYEKRYGPNSPQVALSLYNIGKTKFSEGDLVSAEKYLNQTLAILENSEQDKVYRVLETLIELYQYQALTQPHYINKKLILSKKLLNILENNFPINCPYVNKIRQNLALLNGLGLKTGY